jgi:hypothetical protein
VQLIERRIDLGLLCAGSASEHDQNEGGGIHIL